MSSDALQKWQQEFGCDVHAAGESDIGGISTAAVGEWFKKEFGGEHTLIRGPKLYAAGAGSVAAAIGAGVVAKGLGTAAAIGIGVGTGLGAFAALAYGLKLVITTSPTAKGPSGHAAVGLVLARGGTQAAADAAAVPDSSAQKIVATASDLYSKLPPAGGDFAKGLFVQIAQGYLNGLIKNPSKKNLADTISKMSQPSNNTTTTLLRDNANLLKPLLAAK